MRTIVVATNNFGKVKEFKELFQEDCLLTLKDIQYDKEIEEKGNTFSDNALCKARQVSKDTGYIVLADDSGLEVAALGGEPGVHSARYAKDHDDQANNALLLKKLNGKTQRDARFVCALCLYFPNDFYFMAEGYCTGVITTEARGTNGFGYDPYFLVPEFNQTMAQMPLSVKNKISHRAKALQTLKEKLNENSCN
ncbi:MAG: XTP/dITP diphosphatase [Acholeplasmatales bacterium]|jgi:XTP/dITP diphosphohydrolase|nr:XTP/dITP diphosphatase [Acholeplasmatales bacterium]MCI9653422.1 XTP/dITP diphosphatase [Acholeplasmatales bacterium]